jgi:predicted nuclease of predicted toxin-antitoxin system
VRARLKVDENLPQQIAVLLRAEGYDAVTVSDQGWQGVADETLWPLLQDEQRWLVTADKGFGDLRRYPPGSHAGVILLRAEEQNRRAYVDLMVTALEQLELDELGGAIVVVTPRGVRIRRAPMRPA